MTLGFVVAGVTVVLVVGWALLRASHRPTAAALDKGGERALLDHSPAGALLLDSALRITWTNDAFCELFDLTRGQLIGRGFSEVVQSELKALVVEPKAVESGLLEAYAATARTSPFNFQVLASSERGKRWIEHTCQVIEQEPLAGGRVSYFVDVTPREPGVLAQHDQEIHLHEFDKILLDLSRRVTSTKGDEASLLRGVAEVAAAAWKPDRWELWFLGEDRTRWTLGHLHYATQRGKRDSTPAISTTQRGAYLRAIDGVRVLVTSDVEADRGGRNMLGHDQVEPAAASRLDIPIRVRGKVVGVLVIAHHTARRWTLDETHFAASIGDRMSLVAEAGRAVEASSKGSQIPAPVAPQMGPSSTADGFVHLDGSLRFTFLNPTALRWLDERGLDGSTLIGRALDDAMKGMRDRSIVAEARKAFRGGGPARLRRQLKPNGPWLDLYVNPSATGVSVTIQDRAREKGREAERSLRDSETRFQSVVESLRGGLIITDLNDRIVYVNSRIADLTGHRPEDLNGKQAQELLFDAANWKDADDGSPREEAHSLRRSAHRQGRQRGDGRGDLYASPGRRRYRDRGRRRDHRTWKRGIGVRASGPR